MPANPKTLKAEASRDAQDLDETNCLHEHQVQLGTGAVVPELVHGPPALLWRIRNVKVAGVDLLWKFPDYLEILFFLFFKHILEVV